MDKRLSWNFAHLGVEKDDIMTKEHAAAVPIKALFFLFFPRLTQVILPLSELVHPYRV